VGALLSTFNVVKCAWWSQDDLFKCLHFFFVVVVVVVFCPLLSHHSITLRAEIFNWRLIFICTPCWKVDCKIFERFLFVEACVGGQCFLIFSSYPGFGHQNQRQSREQSCDHFGVRILSMVAFVLHVLAPFSLYDFYFSTSPWIFLYASLTCLWPFTEPISVTASK
jgi:hypothetical protein